MIPRKVCLVTDELHPFTNGGIGRIIHNLIVDSLRREAAVELHVLLPAFTQMKAEEVEAHFGGRVTAHVAEARPLWEQGFDEGDVYPPPGAFTDALSHAHSMELMLHLRRLAAKGTHFDVIEFPDYRGWSFCTSQEKFLGGGFQDTEITVRLHSTAGILAPYERTPPSRDQLEQFEVERKALYDADRVIAHIPGIAALNQTFYGFPETWLEKVIQEFPPVAERAGRAPAGGSSAPDILFVTKVQSLKRPDLFVRGVSTFMRRFPQFSGRAVFACHAPNESYLSAIKALVPSDLRERFVFAGAVQERADLMSRGIVVIPSDFESLNLTAYETAAVGARLVLNGRCPAFVPGTPFADGVNCHTFDGSVDGLADALEKAWCTPTTGTVAWTAVAPYWESPSPRTAALVSTPRGSPPRVTVLITSYNLGRFLPETLASIGATDYPELEVVLVDDASTEALDHEVLRRIECSPTAGGAPVRLVRNSVNRGLPASRNIGLRVATGDYILPLDADDGINPRFIRMAVDALERHPQFDVVVPSSGCFDSDEALEQRRFCDFALFIGDCPSLGMVANRLSSATSLMRRSLFDRFRYNEQLTSYEDWDLYLRLAHGGHRFLVTNAIHFHHRKRPGSMIPGGNPRRHLELLFQLHQGLPRPLGRGIQLAPFLLLAAQAPTAVATATEEAVVENVPLR
ncbi:glycosyltransferase [Myxococcus sp. SDU36]|uniref:glycosyltransferase n=1 Tax=Myxococcus sp. SDU36 TaxID=2831967 RepID=UPI0025432F84|nr:glycosyltransferase [Myxococcus sp. SDU36]WIG98108.1 glycosyltransferase [Myxococcus sp. SDU36]